MCTSYSGEMPPFVSVYVSPLKCCRIHGGTYGTSRAMAREVPYVPPWILQHFKGDTYTLTNGGISPEYDVHIELPPNTPGRGPYDHEQIAPRSSTSFMAVRTMS